MDSSFGPFTRSLCTERFFIFRCDSGPVDALNLNARVRVVVDVAVVVFVGNSVVAELL